MHVLYIHLYSPNKVAMYINEQINKQKRSTSKYETVKCKVRWKNKVPFDSLLSWQHSRQKLSKSADACQSYSKPKQCRLFETQCIHIAHNSNNHLGLSRKRFAIASMITISQIEAGFAVFYSFTLQFKAENRAAVIYAEWIRFIYAVLSRAIFSRATLC